MCGRAARDPQISCVGAGTVPTRKSLPKNFDVAGTEQRLYDWCAKPAALTADYHAL